MPPPANNYIINSGGYEASPKRQAAQQSKEEQMEYLRHELTLAKSQLSILDVQKASRSSAHQSADIGGVNEVQGLREELTRAKEDMAILKARNRLLELKVQKSQLSQRILAEKLERRVAKGRVGEVKDE